LVAEISDLAIAFNALETKRFGIRCARVVEVSTPLAEINRLAREQNISFLSVRVPTDEISRVQALEDDGFRLMDTLIYYKTSLSREPYEPSGLEAIHFRMAEAPDAEAVARVAAQAFMGFYGHFHADTRLSASDSDAVYIDWAAESVRNAVSDLPVLVAEAEGQIIGFLASKRIGPNSGEITLNAVHPNWQGQGVYSCLLEHGLKLMSSADCIEVTISTQINNIAVQKAWGKRGLRMQNSCYTMHKWLEVPGS